MFNITRVLALSCAILLLWAGAPALSEPIKTGGSDGGDDTRSSAAVAAALPATDARNAPSSGDMADAADNATANASENHAIQASDKFAANPTVDAVVGTPADSVSTASPPPDASGLRAVPEAAATTQDARPSVGTVLKANIKQTFTLDPRLKKDLT
jgi:hypothetical protein